MTKLGGGGGGSESSSVSEMDFLQFGEHCTYNSENDAHAVYTKVNYSKFIGDFITDCTFSDFIFYHCTIYFYHCTNWLSLHIKNLKLGMICTSLVVGYLLFH